MDTSLSQEPLVQLVYASESIKQYDHSEIDAIVEQAKKYNHKHRISGMLYYDESVFVQLLEGSRKDVSNLFQRIWFDLRHTNVQILYLEETKIREWRDWSMLHVSTQDKKERTFVKYSTLPSGFNPYILSGAVLKMYIHELSATYFR